MCQTHAGECKYDASTMVCGDSCCIDGECFDLKRHMPPDSLALWLDWTSLYESDKKPIWRDRSPRANTLRSEATPPTVSSSTELERKLLSFDYPKQYLALGGEDKLGLDQQDFLLVIAASLSCDSPDASATPCLLTRAEKDRDATADDEKGRGLRLRVTRGSKLPSAIATCNDADGAPQCINALVSNVACNQMQLITLGRVTPDAAEASSLTSQLELRHNTAFAAQAEVDASMPLDVTNPLRIGGRAANSLIGNVAFVALVVGKVGARERCELERFVLEQLAAADMATAAELPDCSAL
jgi:hypothetical protein